MIGAQPPGRHRRSARTYLLVTAVAIALAVIVLTIVERRHGHLSLFGWLGIALVGVAIVAALLVDAGKRSRGRPEAWEAEASAVRASGHLLENIASILSIISSILAIGALYFHPQSSDHGPGPGLTSLCETPLGGPAHQAALSSSGYQGDIAITGVTYSLYSSDPDNVTAQLHSAVYGQLLGHLPRGYVIYIIGHWDKNSFSIDPRRPGYPHYYPGGEIKPGRNGCWSLPSQDVGEPGSYGLREHMIFMLSDAAAAKAFQKEEAKEVEAGGTGFSQAQLDRLNVTPVDYYELDTTGYDTVEG